ncbi:hypothetical protein [Staphylococcus hominis]|uniref:hypothetical protein n=1 Tax=Staphylococcus hominis TaxID=1290 RepID=UPI001F54605B|nr:hypothetical protein [Staphylococcus hominis]
MLLLIMIAGLIANIEKANSVDIPTLLLAKDIHPWLGVLMSAVMVGVIFNSCVGKIFPFLIRFSGFRTPRYFILLVSSLVLAFILSFVEFADLINIVFPIVGYIGLFIGIALLVRWIYNKTTQKNTM